MLTEFITMDLFEFDCPNKYFDIGADHQLSLSHFQEDTDWFLNEHPLHEAQEVHASQNESDSGISKKRPSLLSSSGVGRIAQTSRKSESSEVLKSAKTAPPTKTVVAATSFSNKSTGQKRSLTEAVVSADDSVVQDKKKAGLNATLNAKGSGNTTSDMSSKLEQYRKNKISGLATNTVGKKPTTNPISSISKSTAKGSSKTAPIKADQDMLEILKKHNEKFTAVPLYEPSRHSVRDVRRWEKDSGKVWASLTPEERELANKQIAAQIKAAD